MIDAASKSWLGAVAPAFVRRHQHWERIERWGTRLTEFFLAQGLLQVLMFCAGIAALRWMSVAEYGLFTFASSVQGMMMTFIDLGIVGSIIPLVGVRFNDPDAVGSYVAAGRQLRAWLFPFTLAIGAGFFAYGIHRHGVGPAAACTLFAVMSTAVWVSLTMALDGAVLISHQRLRLSHGFLLGAYSIRLIVYSVAQGLDLLTTLLAVGLTTLLNGVQAVFSRRTAGPLYRLPAKRDSTAVLAARREIVRFVRPQVPVLLFNAAQGQIMVLVVAFLGTRVGLAEMGAVSRLGQFFAFVPFLLSWIVQPYFARAGETVVARRFAQIVTLAFAGLGCASAVGFLFPQPFLWILGPKYTHLSSEVGWMLAASCTGVAQALVASLCAARRWVYGDAVLWYGGLTLGAQVLAASVLDIATPLGCVKMVFCGTVGGLAGYLILARRGLRHGPPSSQTVG